MRSAFALDHSLTLDSTASSFPALPRATYALVDEIVRRVPAGSTAFLQLNEAYKAVRDERGFDGAQDNDVYNALLKLGMQRGRDWHAKWRAVTDVSGEAPSSVDESLLTAPTSHYVPGSMDVLRAKLDELDAAVHADAIAHSTPRRAPRTPPMLPVAGPSRISTLAPSPVIMTSTPKSARPAKLTSPRPLPHFVTTLKPRVQFPPSPSRASRARAGRARQTSETGSEAVTEDGRFDPGGALADRYRLRTLLGLGFDRWRARTEAALAREESVALAHRSVVLRRSLRHWRERTRTIGAQLEPAAEVFRSLSLVRSPFVQWRSAASRKRRLRWEATMRSALDTVRGRSDGAAIERAFDLWRMRSLGAQLGRVNDVRSLRPYWARWRRKSRRIALLEATLAEHVDAQDQRTLASTLFSWLHAAALRAAERHFEAGSGQRVVARAWRIWTDKVCVRRAKQPSLTACRELVRLADERYDDGLIRATFAAWRGRRVTIGRLERKLVTFEQQRDRQLVRRLFVRWTLRERAVTFVTARDDRSVRASFGKWLDRSRRLVVELDNAAMELYERHSQRKAHSALVTWRDRRRSAAEWSARADGAADRRRLRLALARWREELAARDLARRKADVARAFFLRRNAWSIWLVRLERQRRDRLIERRRLATLRTAFDAWRSRHVRVRELEATCNAVVATKDRQYRAGALKVWLDHVVDVRARELVVQQERDTKTLALSFAKWADACAHQGDLRELVESFLAVKRETELQRTFRRWRKAARQSRYLRGRLEAKLAQDRHELLEAGWDRWRGVLATRRLTIIERQWHDQRNGELVVRAFAAWRDQSLSLPAIALAAKHVKRRAFTSWRVRLPQRIERNKADALYLARIQGAAFKVWREAVKTKAARRAADRFKPYTGRRSSPLARLALPAPPSTPAPSSSRPSMPMSPSEVALQQVRARLAAKARPSPSRLR